MTFPLNLVRFAPIIGALTLGLAAHSQVPERLSFASNKEWKAGRWYLVGQWKSSSMIAWLDGQKTTVPWSDPQCSRSRFIPRIEARSENQGDLEILRNGSWLAIEVNPVVIRESFKLAVRKTSKTVEYCQSELPLAMSLSGKAQGLKPVLIFQPTGNRYYGKKIDISILDLSESADLQLDLSMAYWYMSLPNRQSTGAASALHLFPVAVARLEWLFSDSGRWGMRGFLEQSGASWRGEAKQNLIVSNWGAGIFYQHFLRAAQGLQMRYFVEYSQFRADDGPDDGSAVKSLSIFNLEAHYFNLGIMSHLYFLDRWSLGLEGKYGLPNKMSGRGATQSSYSGALNVNYRVATTMTLISSLGTAYYLTSRSSSESAKSLSLGLRFDL